MSSIPSARGIFALAALLLFACDDDVSEPDPSPKEFRGGSGGAGIGQEVAVAQHLEEGEEFDLNVKKLFAHGGLLFNAVWTVQEGGGRPLTKGTGGPLTTPGLELSFPHNFNRISAPDANSCAGCHNSPASGGGGDIVANVFVLGQRFDFATFDPNDPVPTGGGVDELGDPVLLQTIANSRNTLGMNGSGYIEMLARQMTVQLQDARDSLAPGGSVALVAEGVEFGTLSRAPDGSWLVDDVVGLSAQSTGTTGPDDPPNLIVRPFHQAGAVVSLREFTNNAFNHHHGIQSVERFGFDTDPDGDGFTNELTVADVTAASIWQAGLSAPGFVIPKDDDIEDAVVNGAEQFMEAGCGDCHRPYLTLTAENSVFSEPNPFNPPGNLQADSGYEYAVALSSKKLQKPRLPKSPDGSTKVWAFTDLKLHDITFGPDDPNREPLDMQQPAGSDAFFAGNSRFLTRKLWGIANEAPFYHHGQYTTMRQAIEAHGGEAEDSRLAFDDLDPYDRDCVVEFLKTLQVLPAGTKHMVVDDKGKKRNPPDGLFAALLED